MKNMVEEWESKLTNFRTETMEEKRKTIEKNKKGKKIRGDELMTEDNKNNVDEDKDKENSINFSSANVQRNSGPKKLKLLQRKAKNNDFIDDEQDEEEDENIDEMDLENNDDGVDFESKGNKNKNESSYENMSNRPKRNATRKQYVMDIEDEE